MPVNVAGACAPGRQASGEFLEAKPSEYEYTVCTHSHYFDALVEVEGKQLQGAGHADRGGALRSALRTLEIERENILEGLDCALQKNNTEGLTLLLPGLSQWLIIMGRAQQLLLISLTIADYAARYGEKALVRAARLACAGAMWRLGDFTASREMCLNVSESELDPAGRAQLLSTLGVIARHQGHHAAARNLHVKSLAIRREISDLYGEALTLGNLAIVSFVEGDWSTAILQQQQALKIRRAIGDIVGEAFSLGNLATVHLSLGEYGQAFELQTLALAIRSELGDRRGIAYSLSGLAHIRYLQGELHEAVEHQQRSLAICLELGDKTGMCYALAGAAALLTTLGHWEDGVATLHGALHTAKRLGLTFDPSDELAISDAKTNVEAAQASGKVCTSEIELWQAVGEGMSADELTQHTVSALGKALSSVTPR